MVSWHDEKLPVSLSLVSPSRRVFRSGTPLHFNYVGSTYQFFRIQNPEPGEWLMVVRTAKAEDDERLRTHNYTWGAYGSSPLGIRYELPKELVGQPALKIVAGLTGRREVARSVRFVSSVMVPRDPIELLLKEHHDKLETIDLPFEPDNQEELTRTQKLFMESSTALMEGEAFFSRPYGTWADEVYSKDAETKTTLKKIKAIFDPNNVMNPGKLCF